MAIRRFLLLGACVASAAALPAHAQEQAEPAAKGDEVRLSAAQLFALADKAREAGDFATAAQAYEALANDRDQAIRSEARFRHALMLADEQGENRSAALLLRRILDDEPDSPRVRLELARMLAQMGDREGAGRELRAAQAIGLPDDVSRLVRFYQQALDGRKPFGGGIEIALAPDSNINRATQSDTLGTIIGDFDLTEDAQETSGIGFATRAQAYARLPLAGSTQLLTRVSGSARLYGRSEFDDYTLAAQAGPEFKVFGSGELSLAGFAGIRWFGREPYQKSYGAIADLTAPLGTRARLRVRASAKQEDDRLNDLRDGERYTASVGIDRSLSARAGMGLEIDGDRQVAADPGYSTVSGGVGGYIYREFGRTTAVLRAGYSHLEADQRLFLYPERRRDDRFEISASGTFRALQVKGLAPLVRIGWERNLSTVEIYDYRRISAELGITAAF